MNNAILFFVLFIIYFSFSVILAFLILSQKRKNLLYLFLFFLVQVIYVMPPSLAIFNMHFVYLRLVVGPIKAILTPLIFFYIKGLTQTKNRISLKESLHFVPALVVFILSLIVFLSYPDWKVLGINDIYKIKVEGNFHYTFLITITRFIVFFQGIFYALMIYRLFKKNDFSMRQIVSDLSKQNMTWIRHTAVLVGIRGLANGAELFGVYSISPVFAVYYIFLIGFSFYIFFQAITQPDISFVGTTIQEITDKQDHGRNKTSNNDVEKLDTFTQKKLFLKYDITLQEAADELMIPKYRFTQAIKNAGYPNFYAFVNAQRIEYSKDRLLNLPRNLAMESVVADSGFQSKSTFYRVFKELTGLTPKEYKDMHSSS